MIVETINVHIILLWETQDLVFSIIFYYYILAPEYNFQELSSS